MTAEQRKRRQDITAAALKDTSLPGYIREWMGLVEDCLHELEREVISPDDVPTKPSAPEEP